MCADAKPRTSIADVPSCFEPIVPNEIVLVSCAVYLVTGKKEHWVDR